MHILVEIAQDCDSWDDYPDINSQYFVEILQSILSRYPNFSKIRNCELSVLLTDDKRIAELNHQFRNKNQPTNVLSFPDQDFNWKTILEISLDQDYIYLGDIAFSYNVIKNESKQYNIQYMHHFMHLTIHSILHLLGYDHIEQDDAQSMQALEIQILNQFGLSSPYDAHLKC